MGYLLAAPAEGAGSAPFRSEGLSLMEGADGSGGSSRVGRISGGKYVFGHESKGKTKEEVLI